MRSACIDIGSNTTRLLVADCHRGEIAEVHQDRAFTHLGRTVRAGMIDQVKIEEIVSIVSSQLRTARELGCANYYAVATAAIRRASNGGGLADAIEEACGLPVRVLSSEEEARLAFIGAVRTLDHEPAEPLAVVDVGGGSSELAVGTAPDQVSWWSSIELGSGELADSYFGSDPPSLAELQRARADVLAAIAGLDAPDVEEVVAVGGSAASLSRVIGRRLDGEGLSRSLELLLTRQAPDVAAEFNLDVRRVRLLPAALVILDAVADLFNTTLHIGCGGVREGVLLQAASV